MDTNYSIDHLLRKRNVSNILRFDDKSDQNSRFDKFSSQQPLSDPLLNNKPFLLENDLISNLASQCNEEEIRKTNLASPKIDTESLMDEIATEKKHTINFSGYKSEEYIEELVNERCNNTGVKDQSVSLENIQINNKISEALGGLKHQLGDFKHHFITFRNELDQELAEKKLQLNLSFESQLKEGFKKITTKL